MNGVAIRPRKATRILALAGACGLAILSLSGCIKVNSDLTIASDATGSGTLSLELQKQAASLMMISDLDSFKSGMTSGDLGGQGLGAFSDCEASENSDNYVYTCSFSGETFTAADGPWTIAKDGNQIIFTMVNKGADTGGTTAGSDAAALLGGASLGEINANVTFPGPITGIQGDQATKTSDTTATIKASLTDNVEVRITSDASGGTKIAALLVVLLAVFVLILLVVVVIVLIMRRRRSAAPEAAVAAPFDAGEPSEVAQQPATDDTVAAAPVVLEDTLNADQVPTEEPAPTPAAQEEPAPPAPAAQEEPAPPAPGAQEEPAPPAPGEAPDEQPKPE